MSDLTSSGQTKRNTLFDRHYSRKTSHAMQAALRTAHCTANILRTSTATASTRMCPSICASRHIRLRATKCFTWTRLPLTTLKLSMIFTPQSNQRATSATDCCRSFIFTRAGAARASHVRAWPSVLNPPMYRVPRSSAKHVSSQVALLLTSAGSADQSHPVCFRL